jgi:hypothetical protein
MALEVAHGTVEWLTTTAAAGTYVVSSLTFQPKAIMFFWVGVPSGGADALSSSVDQRRGVGFATSTSARRAVASYDDNGVGTSDCATVAADDCIACTLDNTGARDAELDITAFAANGFTLTVDDQLATGNITVFWIAWGGDDITVAAVGDYAEPAAAGDVNVTVTGFTADGADQVLIVASVQSTAAINTSLVENGGLSIGFATGTGATEQCTVAGSDDHASTATDTDGFGRAGVVQAQCAVGGGTAWITGALSAWGADQFTITYAGTTFVSGRKAIYLAMKGGKWKAGGYAIAGDTGSATATVPVPFAPKGVAIIGRMTAEQSGTTGTAEDRIGIGVGTSTSSRRSQGMLNENATASSNVEVDSTVQFDQVLAFPSATGTLQSAYDIDALNNADFRIIVDTAGGVASEWQGYLAFGDPSLQFPPIVPQMAPMRPENRQ